MVCRLASKQDTKLESATAFSMVVPGTRSVSRPQDTQSLYHLHLTMAMVVTVATVTKEVTVATMATVAKAVMVAKVATVVTARSMIAVLLPTIMVSAKPDP